METVSTQVFTAGARCYRRALPREPQGGGQESITKPDPRRELQGIRKGFSEGVGILEEILDISWTSKGIRVMEAEGTESVRP